LVAAGFAHPNEKLAITNYDQVVLKAKKTSKRIQISMAMASTIAFPVPSSSFFTPQTWVQSRPFRFLTPIFLSQ